MCQENLYVIDLFESVDVRFKANMHDFITDFIKIKYEEKKCKTKEENK